MAVTINGDQIIVDGDNGGTDVVVSQTDISAAASDNSFNDASSGFSGLVAGDRILVKGFSNTVNNGQFIVTSSTTSKIIVRETGRIATESAGASVTIRERGPGYTLKEIDTAVANATYMDVLAYPGETNNGVTIAAGGVTRAFIMKARLLITADSLLKDHNCVWLHTYNSAANDAIEYGNEYATIEMGYLDETDPDKPVTVLGSTTAANIRFGVVYSFMSSQSGQVWSDGVDGIFNFYGGMIKFRDDTNGGKVSPDGENESYQSDFPTRTALIQCNVENFGGATFNGALYRLQEITLKTSRNYGIDFKGATVRRCSNIISINSDVGLELTGAGSPNITEFRMRGHTADLKVNGLTGDVGLLNSDTIGTKHATMTFGTGGSVLEANSYDVEIVDNADEGINGIRCAVYQKSTDIVYGTEELSAGGSAGTTAKVPQLIAKRNEYDSGHTVTPLAYGNFGIRIRSFDYLSLDIEKVPAESALTDTFIIFVDPYLTETNEATVAAYTGFALDEGNEEIDITSAHTMAELYDWLKWKQYQSGQMGIPQLMKTKDGVSYSLPAAWSINGIGNLDMTGKYVINRYVPVQIVGVVSGARCSVIRASDRAELSFGESTGVSKTLTTPYSAATNVYIRARLAGYKPYSILTGLGSTGNNVNANLSVDGEYT